MGASLPERPLRALFDSAFLDNPLPLDLKRALLAKVLGHRFPWGDLARMIGEERAQRLLGAPRPLSTTESVMLEALWRGPDVETLQRLRTVHGARFEGIAAILAFAHHAQWTLLDATEAET